MAAITRPTTTFIQERGTRDGSAMHAQFGIGQNSITRPVWCAWADKWKVARAYIGYSKLVKEDGAYPTKYTGLRRLTPMPHPDDEAAGSDDGPGNMFATRIQGIKGHKATTGTSSTLETAIYAGIKKNVFTKAEIEIQYENPGYQVRTETEMTAWPAGEYERFFEVLEPQPSASLITLPGGTLNYIKNGGGGPTGLPINFNTGKVFPTMQFKFMWHRLPYELFDITNQTDWMKRIWGDPAVPATSLATTPLIGTVNNATWLTFPAGTLLLENVRPIPVRSPFYNVWEWNFEITWNFNVNGWNYLYYFPVASAGATDRGFYLVGAGTTFYANGSIPYNTSLYNEKDHSFVLNVADN